MTTDITGADSQHLLDEGWSTPLEAGVRGTIRGFIEALLEEELEAALGRARYARLRTAADEQEEAASPRIGAVWVPNTPNADHVRPETGAGCGKTARPDLRGRRGAIFVPTATPTGQQVAPLSS